MKRCSRCHQTKPLTDFAPDVRSKDGRVSACHSCEAIRVREYHEARPGLRAQQCAQDYLRHREERLLAGKEYRALHPGQTTAKVVYAQTHQEAHRAASMRYYERNAERLREKNKRYDALHAEEKRARCRRRYAIKMGAEGTHSSEEWETVRNYWGRCLSCGSTVAPLCEDHIVPLCRGGSDSITNIQPLCRECNSAKGTKVLDYRLPSIGEVA